ncbi:MAG: LamG-like jellyroll fold domain-containing protein [Planctomycetota bacterium]
MSLFLLLLSTLLAPQDRQTQDRHVHSPRPAKVLPLPKEEGVFHFVVYGDRTGGPAEGIKVLEQAIRDTNLLGPDLVMTVGDLIQGYRNTRRWMGEMREYQSVMNKLDMRWFPVAGNHDVYWPRGPRGGHEKEYETHFGPLWYWFSHKNAAFIALYTDEGDPATGQKSFRRAEAQQMSQKQLSWLAETLAKVADKDHVFVFMHHPRWLEAYYPGTNWKKVHELLVKAGNVTAVFAGHIHRMTYAGVRDGIEYFSLATVGGGLPQDRFAAGGWLHHLNVVTVRKEGIKIAAIPVGAVMDPRDFSETRIADIDKLRRLHSAGGRILLDERGAAKGRLAYELMNPASRSIEVTLSPAADGPNWHFSPSHLHFEIEPGASARPSFFYSRGPAGFEPFPLPELSVSIAYDEPATRIVLPERRLPIQLGLTALPVALLEAGPVNAAVRLSGRGQCVRIDPASLDLGQGAFTVEAWMKARELGGSRALLAKTESSEFSIFVSEGRPRFDVHLDGRYVQASGKEGSLETGKWYHLAGVYDGAELRLYVNGKLAGRSAGRGTRTQNRLPFYVGADPDGRGVPTSFFAGEVDEVRISRVARYQGASFVPAPRHEPDADTLLLLHLDRELGPFVVDHSPRRAHGMSLGRARYVPAALGQ